MFDFFLLPIVSHLPLNQTLNKDVKNCERLKDEVFKDLELVAKKNAEIKDFKKVALDQQQELESLENKQENIET